MAVMYPADPPLLADGSELKGAELNVRRALETLSDDWIVFHQVQWQGERNGRPDDGEADFVLLNQNHGMIVIEVKGGGVHLEGKQWWSIDGKREEHRIRDPFEQAVSSKKALVRFVKQRGVSTLDAGHVVAFADVHSLGALGPAAPPEITWTKGDLKDIAQSLAAVIRRWNLSTRIPNEFVDRIVSLLAPTVSARPLLRQTIEDVNEDLFRLTNEQLHIMQGLRRNRRVMVFGGAGTGKTVLAVEQALRLGAEGHSVLLTCFNRPLADALKLTVAARAEDSDITVNTFHNICASAARRAGLPSPPVKTQAWWDSELPALLPDALQVVGQRFDAIVVDEGQDFDPSWWILLQLAMTDPDNGWMYVFADAQQAIYRQGWEPPFEQVIFDLSINCRNAPPIAHRVSSVFGDDCATLGKDGNQGDPIFRVAENADEAYVTVTSCVSELLNDEDLREDQLVVLATNRDMVERLRSAAVDGHAMVSTGERGVVVETVARFKGLEADVVLVVFSTFSAGLGESLAYIGMSRARAHLEVIGPSTLAERLGWDVASGPISR